MCTNETCLKKTSSAKRKSMPVTSRKIPLSLASRCPHPRTRQTKWATVPAQFQASRAWKCGTRKPACTSKKCYSFKYARKKLKISMMKTSHARNGTGPTHGSMAEPLVERCALQLQRRCFHPYLTWSIKNTLEPRPPCKLIAG